MEPEVSYFELQAYMGTTKHMGGFETTQELIALCHVSEGAHVLDVGCGVGATACYLAKTYGCRVVGVDLRESMVARSRERARQEGVDKLTDSGRLAGLVEFRVADARDLPFEDGRFDVVMCESVATFIKDRQRVVREYARVTRPGGYVGLNEEIWLKTPPARLVERMKRIWEIESEPPTAEGWREILESAGLRDILVRTYRLNARRESSQLKRYRLRDILGMFYRTLSLYLKSPALRRYMKGRYMPKDMFEYLGYGIFVGVK